MMRLMPLQERPRERLLSEGVDALSLTELLAIVIGSGTRGKSALALGQELIQHFHDLNGLLEATVQELTQIKGIGREKAIKLKAVFGIAQKTRRSSLSTDSFIRTAKQAFELARDAIAYENKEVFFIILKDVKSKLIHSEKIAIGTLSEVLVHPREVFYTAIRHKAHSFIIAHNHPSGDPSPSRSDLELTTMLKRSSKIMGIDLEDHLIVTPDRYISLKEKGYFDHGI